MSFLSGFMDWIYGNGRTEIKMSDTTPNLNVNNPLDILVDTSGKPLTKSQSKDLNQLKKDQDKEHKKKLNLLGKEKLRSLLKEFYFQLQTKEEMNKALYDLRNNDVVNTIVDVMIDDGLMSSNDNKIFNIKYKGETKTEEIQAVIDKFVTQFKLDQIILDFVDEAIILGEYILPIEHTKGIGITKIKDNPYMADMLAIYDGQEKVGFLRKKSDKEIEELEKDEAIHFLLSYKKVRVEIDKIFQSYLLTKEKKYLDQHIKVGKSIILPIVNKLKQLEILEMANLALDLKRILAPVLVMVGMPDNTQSEDIGKIVEEYEKILGNMFSKLGSVDDLKFQDVLSVAGDFKVLPSIGSNKGSISTLNIGEEKDSNHEKAEGLRKSIALLLGIPFYYLSLMGENTLSRLESLKLFSRYSRKLNSMQDCIITGVKELINIHLKDLGYLIDIDDLFIGMRQITNVELLDSMEYLVTLVSAIQELISVLSTVTQMTNNVIQINPEKLLNFLNKLLSEFPECDQLLYIPELEGQQNNNKNNRVRFVDKNKIDNDETENTDDNEFKIGTPKGNLTANNENIKTMNTIISKLGFKNDFRKHN